MTEAHVLLLLTSFRTQNHFRESTNTYLLKSAKLFTAVKLK